MKNTTTMKYSLIDFFQKATIAFENGCKENNLENARVFLWYNKEVKHNDFQIWFSASKPEGQLKTTLCIESVFKTLLAEAKAGKDEDESIINFVNLVVADFKHAKNK